MAWSSAAYLSLSFACGLVKTFKSRSLRSCCGRSYTPVCALQQQLRILLSPAAIRVHAKLCVVDPVTSFGTLCLRLCWGKHFTESKPQVLGQQNCLRCRRRRELTEAPRAFQPDNISSLIFMLTFCTSVHSMMLLMMLMMMMMATTNISGEAGRRSRQRKKHYVVSSPPVWPSTSTWVSTSLASVIVVDSISATHSHHHSLHQHFHHPHAYPHSHPPHQHEKKEQDHRWCKDVQSVSVPGVLAGRPLTDMPKRRHPGGKYFSTGFETTSLGEIANELRASVLAWLNF